LVSIFKMLRGFEDGPEVEFAGFREFEGAGEIGAAGGFEEDGVRSCGEFEGGGGVAMKFTVDEDFGGVWFGGDGELAITIGWGGLSGRKNGRSRGLGKLGGCGAIRGFGRSFRGGTDDSAGNVRIKAMEDGQEIGAAESEADAGDIFLCDFQSVEADYLAAGIQERAARVAGVDGSVGLNPSAGAEGREFSDGTDDSLRGAEEHGVAGIADGEDGFTLLDGGNVGEDEIRKGVGGRRGIGFDESDVEVGVDIDDAGLQLDVGRKDREKGGIAAGDVGVGGDHAGFGYEEA